MILRQGQLLIAIRFFYDCRTGKIKFYTGAIPTRLSSLPEFEHAVSELFRHSLPVEPIKQRQLRRVELGSLPAAAAKIAYSAKQSMPQLSVEEESSIEHVEIALQRAPTSPIEPDPPVPTTPDAGNEIVRRHVEASDPVPMKVVEASPTAMALAVPTSPKSGVPAVVQTESVTKVRVEICSGTTRVLQVLILVFGILGITAIAAFVYLQITEDPGLKHHRLQVEQMRMRSAP
ncbi:MAG: hypothetical protein ACOVMP_09160 [Chthoniobacterales bacterium]